MYSEICAYVTAKNIVPAENRRTIKISAYILLDADGNYDGIEFVDKKQRKDKSAPHLGTYAATEKQANFVCEKAVNIFDSDSKKHSSWAIMIQSNSDSCDSLCAISNFVDKYESDEIFAGKVLADKSGYAISDADVISFKIEGECFEDLQDWDACLREEIRVRSANKAETDEIISSISGTVQKSVPEKAGPSIGMVPNDIKGAFGLGRSVFFTSAKYRSYESYGFAGGTGLQLGLEDAKLFAAGVDHLLSDPNHRNKDFHLIYFYDMADIKNDMDIISQSLLSMESSDTELDEESIEELENKAEVLDRQIEVNNSVISNILDAVKAGRKFDRSKLPESCINSTYYMIQFDVLSSRSYFSNEHKGAYIDLVDGLEAWYNDTLVRKYDTTTHQSTLVPAVNFYKTFLAFGSNPKKKAEDIENEIGSCKADLLNAIYYNKQVPAILYHRALLRSVTAMSSTGRISRIAWIQIIKCYLKRKGLNVMSEVNTVNKAYACGQLFAVYEQMQYLYSGRDLNKNLAQSYFSACVKQPSAIFPQLADLGVVYLNNINHPDEYVRRLGELSEFIGTTFPKSFSDDEKGSFILGYYQQKADFMKRSAERREEKNNNNTEDKGE